MTNDPDDTHRTRREKDANQAETHERRTRAREKTDKPLGNHTSLYKVLTGQEPLKPAKKR
jgi:hypothetical protein